MGRTNCGARCILLAEPFFWDEKDWFRQPADWAPSIQRGKGYDLRTGIGRDLWRQVTDVQRLFDAGYVTVTPDHHFEVSKHIHTDFDDGGNYYKLHGKALWVPARAEHRPGRDYREWHNENRFRG